MNVGFTGTQRGMSQEQRTALRKFLNELAGLDSFHHGDCVGADAEAHDIVYGMRTGLLPELYIFIHPPEDPRKRAFKGLIDQYGYQVSLPGVTILKPKGYLERNRDIVNSVDLLIACPAEAQEVQRSGTWATIRYARRRHVPVVMLV